MSHEIVDTSLFRVDSGANMFVTNNRNHLARFIPKRTAVNLGAGHQGHFEGIGIMIVSCPDIPNSYMLLYPTFLAPFDSGCTITNGGLKKYAGFSRVFIETHEQLLLQHQDGREFAIPFITRDAIDYIQLHIHTPTKATSPRLHHRHMSLQPISITNRQLRGSSLLSMWLHQLYGHRSIATLQEMVNAGVIQGPGLPCKLAPLPGRCPICDAAGATKIPRGPLSDPTELPVGTRWHIDFAFFNEESLRGFTSALIVVEATSRYLWFFPSRCKSAPIDLCLFFFSQMQRQGLPVIRCRSDEDGALVNNTEFCKMMYEVLGTTLESTGGYASNINGCAESPIRTIKRCVRSCLMGSALPNRFWCLAAQHAALTYNNCMHRSIKKVPSKVFTGKTIPLKKMHMFGAKTKVIKHLPSQRALTARTSGDPRAYDANAITLVDAQQQRSSYTGRYVGYSNHHNVMLVYHVQDKAEKISRVHHAIVDHYGLTTDGSEPTLPNEQLLRTLHDVKFNQTTEPLEWKIDLQQEPTLDTIASPFHPDECESFEITLPPAGQSLGITLATDEDYLLPILMSIKPSSDLYDQVPLRHNHVNSWIIQIGMEHPITGQGAADAFKAAQGPTTRTITVVFCKMNDPVRYHHQTYRSVFDSSTALKMCHMVHLDYTPEEHKSIFDALDSDLRDEWIQALYHQFSKNDNVGLCTQPTPIEDVPSDVQVLPVVMSTKVKKKGEDLYQLVARMCANGSKQVINSFETYSPTTGPPCVRITLCLAAYLSLIIGIMDVTNCFQSTLLKQEDRLTIGMPPFYMKWFKSNFPKVKLKESKSNKYVLQLLRGLQGDRSIGRKWYLLIKQLFEKFGFRQCLVEQALYIYEKDDIKMIINTSTDDFLCAYSHESIFNDLGAYLKQYFDITTETGPKISYLNLDIIQSPHGISFDQTEHINDKIIKRYFPPEKIGDSVLKEVHTPYRTDSQYETELLEQLPATGEALKQLEKRYGGTFAGILGSIMHVYVWTRPDIGYACTRNARYVHAPSPAAFAGLYRTLRYLATHTHRPIMYPRGSCDINGTHTIRVDFDPPKFKSMELPNRLIELVDSDHARDVVTRRSCHCVLALLNSVVVHWKNKQQGIVAHHSTDSELRGAFSATNIGTNLQDICAFLGLNKEHYHPLTIYEDSQPCIDILKANSVVSKLKHIAVPTHYMHQLILQGRIDFQKIDTHLNMADSGTKPNPSPTHFRHFDQVIGINYYPPADSEHYKLLKLDRFILSPFAKKKDESK